MKKVLFVYDDHIRPNVFIQSIVGEKGFGQVILKRQSVKSKFQEFVAGLGLGSEIEEIPASWAVEPFLQRLRALHGEYCVLHLFSNQVVRDAQQAAYLARKAPFVHQPTLAQQDGQPVLFMMGSVAEYLRFLEQNFAALPAAECFSGFDLAETDAFFDLAIHANFLQYISGGFDARFFNSVQGDEFTVTKSSADVQKMRAEYQFYHLLPDEMKMWFVMPYGFKEEGGRASYCMERFHMTDLAVRYAHGAIDPQECAQLLHKAFHFINGRSSRPVSPQEVQANADALYLRKLDERVERLKGCAEYPKLAAFLEAGTQTGGIDGIVKRYRQFYIALSPRRAKEKPVRVIGHGDLCFSNMLFNKETSLLKLIDPKGATEEAQLWTDRYYDVAKLSHSVCGRYDFFNNALYHITLDEALQFRLEIPFDNTAYTAIFRDFCEKNGFDYPLVRLYEASLFLSMLPLHMDNPLKVFGFILNGVKILDEVERYV